MPITTGSFAALGGIALSMVTLLAMAAAVLIGGEWIRSEELLNGGSRSAVDLAGGVPAASLQANQSLGGNVAGAAGSTLPPNGSVSNVSPSGSVVNPNNVASGESPISPAQTKAMTMAAIAAAAIQSFRGKDSAPSDSDKAKKVKTKKAKPPKVKKAKVVKKTTVKEFESRRGQ